MFKPPANKTGNPVLKKGYNRGVINKRCSRRIVYRKGAKVGNLHCDVSDKDGSHISVNPEGVKIQKKPMNEKTILNKERKYECYNTIIRK